MSEADILFIGSDPDLRKLSFATLGIGGTVERISVFKLPEKRQGPRESLIGMLDLLHESESVATFGGSAMHCVAVEGQRYIKTRCIDPQDIVHLGQMAGAVSVFLMQSLKRSGISKGCRLLLPFPQEWKGVISKRLHHVLTCQSLGLRCSQSKSKHLAVIPEIPEDRIAVFGTRGSGKPQRINDSDWVDIMDSIALANWARQKHIIDENIAKELRKARNAP